MDELDIYRAALKLYGIEAQLGILQEECAELIVAASKVLRYGDCQIGELDPIIGEIADVEIMIGQIRSMGHGGAIDRAKGIKLRRLHGRITAASKEQES